MKEMCKDGSFQLLFNLSFRISSIHSFVGRCLTTVSAYSCNAPGITAILRQMCDADQIAATATLRSFLLLSVAALVM